MNALKRTIPKTNSGGLGRIRDFFLRRQLFALVRRHKRELKSVGRSVLEDQLFNDAKRERLDIEVAGWLVVTISSVIRDIRSGTDPRYVAPLLRCSFCGEDQLSVEQMFQAACGSICAGCARRALISISGMTGVPDPWLRGVSEE